MSVGIKPPKTFHGKAGCSGRKSVYEEHNKTNAINKLWEKVNKKIEAGQELTEYEEKLVLSLLPKTIQTKVEVKSTEPINVNHNIKFDEIKNVVNEVENKILEKLYAQNTKEDI
jgi:hypothetical protein